MPYHSPNSFNFSMASVSVSRVVHRHVRSFPAQTSVTAVYRHPEPHSPLRSCRKLRSHRPWVKLAPPTMLGWSPRRPNCSSASLAAAPSSQSWRKAICEKHWENRITTFHVAWPGAPCNPVDRSPWEASRCLHHCKALRYFCSHTKKCSKYFRRDASIHS